MTKEISLEKVSEIMEKELKEIKSDIIYLCRASLDFLEMGEPILSRYLAEEAMKLVDMYLRAKAIIGGQSIEDEALKYSVSSIVKVTAL